jgi:hypothetical protein
MVSARCPARDSTDSNRYVSRSAPASCRAAGRIAGEVGGERVLQLYMRSQKSGPLAQSFPAGALSRSRRRSVPPSPNGVLARENPVGQLDRDILRLAGRFAGAISDSARVSSELSAQPAGSMSKP